MQQARADFVLVVARQDDIGRIVEIEEGMTER
jgi:hypothetical protein